MNEIQHADNSNRLLNGMTEHALSCDMPDLLAVPSLKACPFCGGNPLLRESTSHSGFVVSWFVSCDTCGIRTPKFSLNRTFVEYRPNSFCNTDKLLAVRRWNCRPGMEPEGCKTCGVIAPHEHMPRHNPHRNQWEQEEILVVPLDDAEEFARAQGKRAVAAGARVAEARHVHLD